MFIKILAFFLCIVLSDVLAGEMTRFHHESGLSFSYPEEWVLRESEDGLYLIPDGVARVEQGMPKEFFFFGLSEAAGVASVSDPEVLVYFEQMIKSDVPGGTRTGNVQTLQTGVGRGLVIPFTGKPQGIESDILVYVLVRDEEGLYLVHVRDKTAISDPQMGRTIFASLNLQLQIDADLAGSWIRTEHTSSSQGSYDPSQFSTTHLVRFVFDATGRVAMKSDFSASSVSDDVTTIDDDASYFHGTYSSTGEELTIEWDDETVATWIYSVFPDYNDGHMILKLQKPGDEPKFYNLSN